MGYWRGKFSRLAQITELFKPIGDFLFRRSIPVRRQIFAIGNWPIFILWLAAKKTFRLNDFSNDTAVHIIWNWAILNWSPK